tara:strand:+ start:754 stop:1038 length:285 start_codon:yes stop_codon:yes gene_type:complete
MSAFKQDKYFCPQYDDTYESSDSDEGCTLGMLESGIGTSSDSNKKRREWLNEHFDVLSELYRNFIIDGQRVFGAAFFQRGGFHTFIELVYENTH